MEVESCNLYWSECGDDISPSTDGGYDKSHRLTQSPGNVGQELRNLVDSQSTCILDNTSNMTQSTPSTI